MKELSQILAKIPLEVLMRHYGISNQVNLVIIEKSSISLGKVLGKLLCVQLKDLRKQNVTEIFLWGNTDSKTVYFPLTEEITFFCRVLTSLKTEFLGEIEFIGKIPQNWNVKDLTQLKIDVTNFHFIINTKEKNYRLKWYSRPKKGYKEFLIQANLTEFQIAPRAEFLVAYRKKAVFGVYEEYQNVRNLDELTGEKYIELINDRISPEQFFLEMRRIFIDITELILRLQKVESSLLEKRLIQPYSSLEWQMNLNDNWQVIKRSSLFTFEEKNKMDDHYLPLLGSFLEETDSRLIHGDIWMRQFGMSLSSNQLRLFDFEDMKIGPRAYDFASQINSIAQQYEFFRMKCGNNHILHDEHRQTLIDASFSTLPSNFSKNNEEIHYCQSLRMVHEIKYLLDHQPKENWLISYIKQQLIDTLEKLKQD
jgi:hypothetical protein